MGGNGSGRRPSARTTRHGTVNGYSRGCRCVACRSAWAAYIRERRRVGARRKPRYYSGPVSGEKVVALTPLGAEILEAVQARERRPVADIVEHLLRLHGRDLKFNEEVTAA